MGALFSGKHTSLVELRILQPRKQYNIIIQLTTASPCELTRHSACACTVARPMMSNCIKIVPHQPFFCAVCVICWSTSNSVLTCTHLAVWCEQADPGLCALIPEAAVTTQLHTAARQAHVGRYTYYCGDASRRWCGVTSSSSSASQQQVSSRTAQQPVDGCTATCRSHNAHCDECTASTTVQFCLASTDKSSHKCDLARPPSLKCFTMRFMTVMLAASRQCHCLCAF